MRSYRVRAVNTAADSENKIHDDAIAAQYGFRGGLVPGVTVYGYMTLPVLEHFGEDWLERGVMSVRFQEPVYDGEEVTIESRAAEAESLEVTLGGGRVIGTARMGWHAAPSISRGGDERVLPAAGDRPVASHESLAPGVILGTLHTVLDEEAARMSAPLPPWIGKRSLAQPAVLLSLANQVLIRNVVLGPWIHVGSEVANYSAARAGDEVSVEAQVAGQYERRGHEFVTLDVVTSRAGRCLQSVRHTAIWRSRYT